jgi:hypothetical protein
VSKATSLLTWSSMRADARRDWYRLSDLYDATMASGRRWTVYEIRRAMRHLPKPAVKKYGHYHYGQEHMDAVREAVRREVARG